MNEALAAKSRENSELKIQVSDLTTRLHHEIEKYQEELEDARLEKSTLQLDLDNLKKESDIQINNLVEERNSEISRLNRDLTAYAAQYEDVQKKLITKEGKYDALEETLNDIKKSSGVDIKKVMDVAELKADLLAVTKEKSYFQEQFHSQSVNLFDFID
jgi:hypothetical protein